MSGGERSGERSAEISGDRGGHSVSRRRPIHLSLKLRYTIPKRVSGSSRSPC